MVKGRSSLAGPDSGRIPAREVVVAAATTFLRSQQSLLRSGLEHATEPHVADEVARRHAASTEAWASTVAVLGEHVPGHVVTRVVELHGFHARVAQGLADEESMRASGPIETAVRRLLADQLDQMTDRCVGLLEALPGA